jgi:sugar/nucleoside kinase (ribokinase family)
MDCWIKDDFEDLKRLLGKIDCLIINDGEARLLADDHNLVKASEKILGMGPGVVVIKKGESGSMACKAGGEMFVLPAYPAAEVKDPTGAGDSFAGGLMGYLAQVGRTDFDSLKKAVAYGTVVASFTIADFSLAGLTSINKTDIDGRLETLQEVTRF